MSLTSKTGPGVPGDPVGVQGERDTGGTWMQDPEGIQSGVLRMAARKTEPANDGERRDCRKGGQDSRRTS